RSIKVIKLKIKIFLIFSSILLIYNISYSQDINDTSKVIIKKVAKIIPDEYNISDTHIKQDKDNKNNYIIRVDVDVPSPTKLTLSVTDTSGAVLMYLINDQTVSSGKYRVRWEMLRCFEA